MYLFIYNTVRMCMYIARESRQLVSVRCQAKTSLSVQKTKNVFSISKKEMQKNQSIHQPTQPIPTKARVFQRRRPMVNTRLQNCFPRQ
ncbi:hypothetical protein BU24DRAFT_108648 [Aaosphaeria arxii CBS 175.79]|uniref:Uncharacterized protein n=1 Tax=Aaosphaeria arxii CBS 175.79 TaxID=1450172 RepID=A0A6A5Y072_9PLEO|nr:uncharacterized protein BU24DRAFT_108648 [Aaosphaeria arxii CBS 175.79]KAF2018928.1 hypothetical protein BU24DRAFT_108648 [Aaosphaeria arxii CBS 175.79]